jgi:hypothetical protein
MPEKEDDFTKETKRKQEYLKGSNFVEIKIESPDDGLGEIVKLEDGSSVFTQSKHKSIRATEVRAQSNE